MPTAPCNSDTKMRSAGLRIALVMGMVSVLALGLGGPVAASTRPGSYVVVTTSPSSVPIGGTITIQMCMTDGLVGTILPTDSGLGTSGLEVKSPGGASTVDPTGATTAWTYSPAAGVTIPACGSGEYSVKFGDGTPGWVRLSGPNVEQTAEGGTYDVDLNYAQNNVSTGAHAVFDISQPFSTPEFGVPVAVVTAISLLGLVTLRRRFV